MSKIEQIVGNLIESRNEILEAMIARRGKCGKEYADIVIEAAATVSAIQACSIGAAVPLELDDRLKHAIICVITYATMRVTQLMSIHLVEVDDKLIGEITTDVRNVARYMVKVIKREEL